jgi:transposase InsO family protein
MAPTPMDPPLDVRSPWPAPHHDGHSDTRRPDGRGEPAVGRASDPWRVEQARHRRLRANRLAALAETRSSTVTDLAHLPHESGDVPRVDGLLHRADTHRPRAVRARATRPPPPPNVHLAITEHPTAAWTAQQIIEAFPDDTAPRWLLRDRDAIYGDVFRRRVAGMGITEVITSPSSPWQNPYAERLIGSIRRECLDHVIVLGERHLRRLLTAYRTYYHGARTHLALEKDAPTTRRVQTPTEGLVVAFPEVGGLHHRYERRAA